MNKREQRRLAAAEEVCRAFRQAMAYYGTQNDHLCLALDWLLVWMDNAPKKVKYADARPAPRRRERNGT